MDNEDNRSLGTEGQVSEQCRDIYTVQSWDSIYSIARRYGVTVQDLVDANPGIYDPDSLEVGQQLCIPEVERPAPPRPAPPRPAPTRPAPSRPTQPREESFQPLRPRTWRSGSPHEN